MSNTIEELNKHYEQSKSNYDIQGESHLEYYKDKFPENYNQLIKYNIQP